MQDQDALKRCDKNNTNEMQKQEIWKLEKWGSC